MKFFAAFNQKMYALILPAFLLFHNPINFTRDGASDCYRECLSHFMTNFADEMEDKRGLRLINHVGCMDCKIYSIGLQWQVEGAINVPQARLLILELMDAFLVQINSFKRLQPYLDHCPWTMCNISEFRIDFVDDCYYHYPSPGTISNVTYLDGSITYNMENPRCLGEILKLRDETFYDALQFVGWFYGQKHFNRLLNPMPPPGDDEDIGDWLLGEAKDFYALKRRLYELDHNHSADLVTSPSIHIVNVSGKSTQGTPSYSLIPVANPLGMSGGQMAAQMPPQQMPQGLSPSQINPQNLGLDTASYAGGLNPYLSPYGGAYDNLGRLDPARYNSLNNSLYNEPRYGQENPFNPRQTLTNPTRDLPRTPVGGIRR